MAPEVPITKAVARAGKHHPVELTIGSSKRLAMIKNADIDPVKHQLRHVAFHIVKQNEEVETEIPVVITDSGETPAEKAGLVVLTAVETVTVKALPNSLPDQLVLPGEKLVEVGDHLTVADIKAPKGVTITSEPEQTLVTVYEPGALQAANERAAGTAGPDDVEAVPAEEGADTPQETQAEEDRPGGKKQFEPKGE
jgi:large subunit ribosomal protein L25